MTIKREAKTLIDYEMRTDTRMKLEKLTEFDRSHITRLLQRSANKRTGIKRVLQSSDNSYAVQEVQQTSEMVVIEL